MTTPEHTLANQVRLQRDRELVSAWLDGLADGECSGSREEFVLRDVAVRVLKGEHITWAEGDDA